jgi:hypothetical protein
MTGRKKRSRTHRSSPRPFPSPSSKYRNIRKENWKKKKECQKHKRKSFILELLGQRRRRRRQCRSKGKKTYRITHPSLSSASFSSSACVDRVLKLGTRRPDSLLRRITYIFFFFLLSFGVAVADGRDSSVLLPYYTHCPLFLKNRFCLFRKDCLTFWRPLLEHMISFPSRQVIISL